MPFIKKYSLILILLGMSFQSNSQVWTQKTSCPYGSFEPGFYFSHNNGNKIYVAKISATGNDSIVYYNTLTDSWHYYGLFPGQAKYSTAICVNNKAYVFSGKRCFNFVFACYTSEVWELDLLTDVWTQKNNFNSRRMDHSLTYNASTNKIYINFGLSAINFTSAEIPQVDSYAYDIATDTYSVLPSFSISGSGRFGHTAYSTGNAINIYWGGSSISPAFTFGNNLTFNLSTNTWSAVGTPIQRKYGATFEIGGVVYVGMGFSGGDPVTQNTDFYAISPFNNSIPAFPGIPFHRGLAVSCGGKGYLGLGTNLTSGFEPAPRIKLDQLWEFNPIALNLDKKSSTPKQQTISVNATLVDNELVFDTERISFNVEIQNMLGQSVLKTNLENKKTLTISELNKGIYNLRMQDAEGNTYIQKIIKY